MEYLTVKWLHILSATLLFGTGLGSAFYKFMTDRSGNLPAIAQTNRLVVLADWLFTTPTIILQPVTGVWMVLLAGIPLTRGWLLAAIALYVLAGLCWLPVVYLQIRMRDMADIAVERNQPLGSAYAHLALRWFWLGVPAFVSLLVVYYLMVFKPTF
jgi:uncharacterized membrane protein